MTESGLVTVLKDRFNKFTFDIVDEDLTAYDTNYLRFNSVNINWVTSPPPNVRFIDTSGVETTIVPAGYTVNAAGGYVTLSSARASSDIVRADYSFFPFSDAQLLSIVQAARKQMQVLLYRPIDANDIADNYQEAVLKRCYSIALREMQFPTVKYFTISVGGRSIGKENQVTMIDTLIKGNEEDLLKEINALRYFDKTNTLT